ncbi:MAG: IS1182 family transposase [Butyrivibrio sp.]|jgi:transposase|nr:IS1182 family transposase [Bacteroidales bacterium]MBQ5495630.1 IS1182 family transposase [Prevotella sp.]MEE3497034.1 IS1182 family transposase [Butyrivibrio sp.]
MLSQQQELVLSEYSALYDIVVPQDNLLRRINGLVDFSFVYQELLDKYCPDNGRMAESPIRMFKYLLLKVIYDISDVDVVERSRYDMSFKFFLGIAPEAEVINPSSLSKFRKLRLKDMDLLNLLIKKTVDIAIEKGVIKSKTIIVDATHTGSRSNPYSPIEILRLRSKQLRKTIYNADEDIKDTLPKKNEDDDLVKELDYTKELLDIVSGNAGIAEVPAVKQRINMLKETLEDIEDHYTTSKDEDARMGHKSEDSSFFGYKTHIAMSDERIITAAVVTSGEKGDGPQLESLVEQSRSNGMEVDTVIGDTAYSGTENLRLAENEKKGFELVAKLHPVISNGFRKEEDKFDFNKDAGMFVCPAGHMAVRKARCGKKNGQWNQTWTYYFDVDKCKTCSRRDGCYKEGAKFKTYSVPIKTGEQERLMEFQKTPEFKAKARERYKIEAKNAELKHVYGYDRAESYGLCSMQMQGAITIFAANIKRILKLI